MVKNLKTAESAKLAWANWSPSCQMARYWQGLESPIIWNFTVNYPSIIFFCKQSYAVLPWLKFRDIVAISSQSSAYITIHMDKSLVINLGFPMVFPWFSPWFSHGFSHVFPHGFSPSTSSCSTRGNHGGSTLTRTWRLCWIRSWRRVMPAPRWSGWMVKVSKGDLSLNVLWT